jgi:hypothetical protein
MIDFLSELSDFSLRLLSEFLEERVCRHFLFFDFVLQLFSQFCDHFLEFSDFGLSSVEFLFDFDFLFEEGVVLLVLFPDILIHGFLMVFSLVLEFGGDLVNRPDEGFDPAPHAFDFCFILPELGRGGT